MRKADLTKAVEDFRNQTKDALQTVYDVLNQGQRKQIVKNEKVKKFLMIMEWNIINKNVEVLINDI